jgi:hypothetical protein
MTTRQLHYQVAVGSGGRHFRHAGRVLADFIALRDGAGLERASQGGAPGADGCIRFAQESLGLAGQTYPALWETDGRGAGPRRNVRMLEAERPSIVPAYPDENSVGTWHCIRETLRRQIPVAVWLPTPHAVVSWGATRRGGEIVDLPDRPRVVQIRKGHAPREVLQLAPEWAVVDQDDARLGHRLVVVPDRHGRVEALREAKALADLLAVPALDHFVPPAQVQVGDVWEIDGATWRVVGPARAGGWWPLSGPGPGRAVREELAETIAAGRLVSRVAPRGL